MVYSEKMYSEEEVSKLLESYKEKINNQKNILDAIFATTDCGVMRHTVDGSRIISINQAALDILGYESKEDMMRGGFDLIAASVVEEDQPKLRQSIRKLKQAGDSTSVDYRVRHGDGEILDVMGRIKLLEEDGEMIYQRFLLDCTAQKLQQTKEIKKKEQQHQEMIYALTRDYSSVYFLDLDREEVSSYRVDYEILGKYAANLTGKIQLKEAMKFYAENMVFKADREKFLRSVTHENLMKELSEKPMLYVNYRTCSGGGLEYYQMKAVRVGQWKKEHTAVLGFHSIDEEIRNEIEQKKQLEDALAQAEKASRAKTTFLNNMSHDIRTPMNAVIGFTALASSHLDNKEQVQDYLTKIMTSSNHLLSLINDVLDMSRIESGQIHIEEVPCNLSEIMQDLKVVMIGQVQEKQIELHIDTEAVRNENIYCDKLRLNQILLNLLGNAVKFTGEQGSISVRVVQTPEILVEGYAVYEFHVIDNGIGMSEEFQKHLFEPFSRARTSTVSGLQGTGLGLSITKNIVDLMGGTIAVTSRENEGTEITVKLNLKLQPDSQKADEQAAACEEINAKEEKVNFAGKRILLAEDNELNREIAVDILKEYGFEIKSVENGQEAVSEIAGSEVGCYDAVLMDIQMPVMDGYEATRAIRSLSNRQLAQIPVIAMTANAFAEDKRLSKAAGMDGYVAKPVDIGRLIDTLSRIIK